MVKPKRRRKQEISLHQPGADTSVSHNKDLVTSGILDKSALLHPPSTALEKEFLNEITENEKNRDGKGGIEKSMITLKI